jgi:hypothetical protein
MKQLLTPCILGVLAALASVNAVAQPILEFKFNTPGFRYTDEANRGSGAFSTGASPLKLGFRNGLGGGPPRGIGETWYVSNGSFYSASGAGISGLPNDWAYQNDTADSDMGGLDGVATDNQAAAIAEGVDPNLEGLEQLTVCGWFYARGTEPLRNYARLVSNLGPQGGFELRSPWDTPGLLELRLNAGSAISPAVFTAVEEWVFFAVTYDSTAAGQEVQFFIGSLSEEVARTGGAIAMAEGAVGPGQLLTIGNSPGGGTRSFSGNFDNIRVYGEALTLAQLQEVRAMDMGPQINLPLPPSSLTASAQSSTEIFLEWRDNSDDEAFFELVRMEGGVATVIELPADTTAYLDSALSPDTRYTYTIASVTAEGSSPPVGNVTISTPPSVDVLASVGNIRVIDKSSTTATIGWDDQAQGEAGYVVERFSEGSQLWEVAAVLPANAQQADFNRLSNANLQRFRVFAFNGALESDPVEIVFELRNREFSIGGIKVFEIDESEVTRIVHVDPVNGDDSNDGSTLASAKRTITSAFEQAGNYNRDGEGTRILLQPGIYQEGSPNSPLFTGAMIGIGAGSWGNPGKPIILEGAGWDQNGATQDVIIQGSNRYTDWTPVGDNVYEHAWTIDWGVNATHPFPGSPAATRSYHGVNVRPAGERYWQMYYHMTGPNDPNIVNLEPHEGYFWVDEEADIMRVKAPPGVDLTDPNLEVHVNERHRVFQFFQATGSAGTNPHTPFVIRNIVFRHGYHGPFLQNVGGAIVEDCSFENFKLFGFVYNGSFPGLVVRRCEFIRNGHSGGGIDGVTGGQSDYLLEELFFLENGRQAVVNLFRGHFESQIKLAYMNGATFRDFHMVGAQGVGFWLDTGLSNFEAYNGIIEGGITAALFIENHNRNNISNLGDQLTVYVRDLWLRDGVFDRTQNQDNTKGLQTAESENWVADNLWIEGQARPFNFAYNNRGDLFQNTIKNTVALQTPTLPFYFGETTTWGQAFDTFIPDFGGNRYYGGSQLGFLGRGAQSVSFEDWVFGVNNNPSRNISGIEEGSLRVADMAAARPTLGAYPTSREMREGDSLEKGVLITRMGASVESALTVDLQYSSGIGYTSAEDFHDLPRQVTIPADAISVYLPLSITADGREEGLEVFEVQVLEQGSFEVLAEPARINVIDADTSDLPLFKVISLGDRVYENLDEALRIRILREGRLGNPVSLQLQDTGTATLGVDYTVTPETVTFDANTYEQIVEIRPIADTLMEGLEIIQLQLVQTTSEPIVILAPGSVQVPLNDNDGVVPEQVALTINHDGSDYLEAGFTLSNPSNAAIRYDLNWQGFVVDARGSQLADGPDPADFIDISASGTASGWNWFFPNDDGFSRAIELPWSFFWYGEAYTTIHANSNGFIVFGNPANLFTRYAEPVLLPMNTAGTAANALAIAWANLRMDGSSGLYSQQVGDTFIIQWDDFLLNSQRVTFQLQFEEGNVVTAYYQKWPSGQDIMVGYQDRTKEAGGTVIPLEPLPGTPFAIRFSGIVPVLSSSTARVELAAGASQTVNFNVAIDGLASGMNRSILAVNADGGHEYDQRLPFMIEYTQNPALAVFGDLVIDAQGDWLQVNHLGWIHTADWPYVYHAQLGWLYLNEQTGAFNWYALEWASGWFLMHPDWYPYAFLYNNDAATNNWGYLMPESDAVLIYVFGSDWTSLPRD